MANDIEVVSNSYIDNYAIKEFVSETMIPKYFPDVDVSRRTIGMLGLTSELISNISEDGFNATSVLFRETFPNRAEIPESIYSHAAIFQLSNIFSSASICSFLIVLEEDAIINNMKKISNSGKYEFFLDKDTTIYVENVPYVLDYDIRIICAKRRSNGTEDYVFNAMYDVPTTEVISESVYSNTISNITSPYIKIRRSSNGYLALEVTMHQITRVTEYERIITNSKINLPTVDISFEGQLVGFDVLYKTTNDTVYNTQLQKLLVYSQPITSPFCYYQLYDDSTLRLTFNSKDTYFTPEFNAELKVILYISNGKTANFDSYIGNNISVVTNTDNYEYKDAFIMGAKPLTASTGGDDRLTLDELQALTVESYRTALALTTEPDLMTYFANYKYRYGDFSILFIKRRNDVYERLFGGYCILRHDNDIYRTNTLDISMNLSDMENTENNIYIIEPGSLFVYKNDTDNYIDFYRDPIKDNEYYQEYLQAIEDGTIQYITDNVDPSEIPAYLNRPASFAEFKKRKGYQNIQHVLSVPKDELEAIDNPITKQFVFINPFLIRFKKNPNMVSLYSTFINEKSTVDFTANNSENENVFVEFVTYQVQIERYFELKKEYTISTAIMPSITVDNNFPMIDVIGHTENNEPIYNLNNRLLLDTNDTRVIFVIYNKNNTPVCYSEMYPVSYIDDILHYETKFCTDDYITSDGYLRLVDDTRYYIIDDTSKSGWYYKVQNNDATKYDLYDTHDNVDSTITVDEFTALKNKEPKALKYIPNLVTMNHSDDILIPMENVVCKIFTLYRRKYGTTSEGANQMILCTNEDTDNNFIEFDGTPEKSYLDSTYASYIWTNEYTCGMEPLTFMKPLNNVRCNLYFEDYTTVTDGKFVNDIMDVRLESVPCIKWNLAYQHEELGYLMSSFLTQYENISNIITEKLRNETSIDTKFYNTYGRSKNYYIGDDREQLNMLNLHITFDIWFLSGTDLLQSVQEVKRFIKDEIETLADNCVNQIHISNLMRKIEYQFSYVDHIRFRGINSYSTDYQSVKLIHTDINDMSKEERRQYIPEMLVVDIDDITINEYIVDVI